MIEILALLHDRFSKSLLSSSLLEHAPVPKSWKQNKKDKKKWLNPPWSQAIAHKTMLQSFSSKPTASDDHA
jgi:hypothetical protein